MSEIAPFSQNELDEFAKLLGVEDAAKRAELARHMLAFATIQAGLSMVEVGMRPAERRRILSKIRDQIEALEATLIASEGMPVPTLSEPRSWKNKLTAQRERMESELAKPSRDPGGRPREDARYGSIVILALIWHDFSGVPPSVRHDRATGEISGKFHDFVLCAFKRRASNQGLDRDIRNVCAVIKKTYRPSA